MDILNFNTFKRGEQLIKYQLNFEYNGTSKISNDIFDPGNDNEYNRVINLQNFCI